MKFLLVALFSFNAAAAGLSCDRLTKILKHYEKDLMQKSFASETDEKDKTTRCTDITAASLGMKDKDAKDLVVDKIHEDVTTKYRCKDLSVIELEIRSIENELAMLRGIEAVKADLTKAKDDVKVQKQAEVAAKDFLSKLDIARHLELLVNAPKGKKQTKTFLEYVAERSPADWEAKDKFLALRLGYCDNKLSSNQELCSEEFKPDDATFNEIHNFIKGGVNSQKFNADQTTKLSNALKIKNKDDKGIQTFTGLYLALKNIKLDGPMSKEVVKAIKELPDFESSVDFQFLNDAKLDKAALTNQTIGAQFRHHLIDLHERQNWEIKSKMSLVLLEYSDVMDESLRKSCESSVNDITKSPSCFENLGKKLTHTRKQEFMDTVESLTSAIRQKTRVAEHIQLCPPDKDLNFPKRKVNSKDANGADIEEEVACDNILPGAIVELQKKHQALDKLKEKILAQNEYLARLRNHVIEQYQRKKCAEVSDSVINNCYDSGISKEAIGLTSDTLNVLIFQNQKTKDTDIRDICEAKGAKFTYKSEICALEDEKTDEEQEYENWDKDRYRHTTETNDNYNQNPVRNAAFDVLGMLAGYTANTLYNPYMSGQQNYAPYYPTSTTPAYTYSQYNAMMGAQLGYGFYPVSTYPGGSYPTRSTYFDPKWTAPSTSLK